MNLAYVVYRPGEFRYSMKTKTFVVTGHGEQTPCAPDDKTEIDGMDEALVPCDAVEDKATWIIDNVRSPFPVKSFNSYEIAGFA